MFRDSAASTVGVLLQGGARFAVSVLVGRIAGPSALALVNGSLSLATVASLLWPTSAGMTASIIIAREEAGGRADLVPAIQRHLTRRTTFAIVTTIPVVTILAATVLGIGWPDALWVAALAGAFSAYNLCRGLQFGRGLIGRATRWEGASAAVTLGLLVGVLLADLAGLYLMPLTFGYLTYAVAGWPRERGHGEPLPHPLRREVDRYVTWGVVGTLASTGLLHLSMVIALATERGQDAGLYAAAISIATPATMLASAFSMALSPAMARSVGRDDARALAAQTDSATRALVTGMVMVFGVIALSAPGLIHLLYGPRFEAAADLLSILLIAVLFSTLPVAATNSITARGSGGVRAAALMAAVSMVAGVVSMALLAAPYGLVGVSVGFLIGAIVKAALPLGFVWRQERQRWTGLAVRATVGVLGLSSIGLMDAADPHVKWSVAVAFSLIWGLTGWRDLQKRQRCAKTV